MAETVNIPVLGMPEIRYRSPLIGVGEAAGSLAQTVYAKETEYEDWKTGMSIDRDIDDASLAMSDNLYKATIPAGKENGNWPDEAGFISSLRDQFQKSTQGKKYSGKHAGVFEEKTRRLWMTVEESARKRVRAATAQEVAIRAEERKQQISLKALRGQIDFATAVQEFGQLINGSPLPGEVKRGETAKFSTELADHLAKQAIAVFQGNTQEFSYSKPTTPGSYNGTFEAAKNFVMGDLEGGAAINQTDGGVGSKFGVLLTTAKSKLPGRASALRTAGDITKDDANAVYKSFWDAIDGDNLPNEAKLPVFAFAINAGEGTAARMWESSGGSVEIFLQRQAKFYADLVAKPAHARNKKAWEARLRKIAEHNGTGVVETQKRTINVPAEISKSISPQMAIQLEAIKAEPPAVAKPDALAAGALDDKIKNREAILRTGGTPQDALTLDEFVTAYGNSAAATDAYASRMEIEKEIGVSGKIRKQVLSGEMPLEGLKWALSESADPEMMKTVEGVNAALEYKEDLIKIIQQGERSEEISRKALAKFEKDFREDTPQVLVEQKIWAPITKDTNPAEWAGLLKHREDTVAYYKDKGAVQSIILSKDEVKIFKDKLENNPQEVGQILQEAAKEPKTIDKIANSVGGKEGAILSGVGYAYTYGLPSDVAGGILGGIGAKVPRGSVTLDQDAEDFIVKVEASFGRSLAVAMEAYSKSYFTSTSDSMGVGELQEKFGNIFYWDESSPIMVPPGIEEEEVDEESGGIPSGIAASMNSGTLGYYGANAPWKSKLGESYFLGLQSIPKDTMAKILARGRGLLPDSKHFKAAQSMVDGRMKIVFTGKVGTYFEGVRFMADDPFASQD